MSEPEPNQYLSLYLLEEVYKAQENLDNAVSKGDAGKIAVESHKLRARANNYKNVLVFEFDNLAQQRSS